VAHHVYLSYSSWDRPVAGVACRELEATGISCWVAPRAVTPGSDWTAAISAAVAACRLVVLILSTRSDSSRNVHQEVKRAVKDGKQVAAVRIAEFAPGPVPLAPIRHLHCLDAAHRPLPEAVQSLADNIHQTLQRSASAAQVGPAHGPRTLLQFTHGLPRKGDHNEHDTTATGHPA
jgi:hypothetical protein